MKNRLFIFLVVTFCIILNVSTFAQSTEIELTGAVLNGSNIEVSGKITGAADNQQLTLMATDLLDGSYNADGIFYLDQKSAELDSDGNFSVSFGINKVLTNESIYIIRVGGTNIDTPAQMILSTIAEDKLLLGDVNLDGIITANDAALTLQYVLFKSSELSENQIAAMRVTKSDAITSNNAAEILAKAINSMYVFTVEQ